MELPLYRCHKEVRAARIESAADDQPEGVSLCLSNGALVMVSHLWWDQKKAQVGGYYVVYEDGYASYSPAKAFEDGYTLVQTTVLRPTIDQLEQMLGRNDGSKVNINPDGSVTVTK